MKPLVPSIDAGRPALIVSGSTYTHGDLERLSAPIVTELSGRSRVALWATHSVESVVGVRAALQAGVTLVPVNPATGSGELGHLLADAEPEAVICGEGRALPQPLASLPRIDVHLGSCSGTRLRSPDPSPRTPALILYTSGTTGPPKGVVISHRAIASCLDGLADAWDWSEADVVAHALPLSHAHGMILGVIGPFRLGGAAMLLDRFSPPEVEAALRGPATMLFGVPTMYRRLRQAAEEDRGIASALGRARLLVSGSAALPAGEHAAIERLTGQRIVERYGMTETLITLAARSDGNREPGKVGRPLPGVEVRLVEESGKVLPADVSETVGELEVRGPTLFDGYLGLPDTTKASFRDGWFATGDLASRDRSGSYRILGRRDRDLIKTGGYRVGAGEVEAVLLEHHSVDDAVVAGEPDDDLGQRIVAWVVPRRSCRPKSEDLIEYAAGRLSWHKRPREVRLVDSLPRNAVGKVELHKLTDGS